MKKTLMVSALALSVCLLGGCDFFRQLAGRPTSRDIEAKRVRIEQEAISHQRRIDSLKAVQKQISDSLATLDSLRNSKESLISTKQLPTKGKYQLDYRYYVMIGAFSTPAYASRQASKAEAAGYEATLIPFKNGFTAIGICPSNSLPEVFASLRKVRREKFCPADAWILNNENL
ncbi:MAG: SPOR domain-containing protein [Bacteroidales bacterium]|nr:SPOR domain-containing protein [Bacteroidales bacterium]